MHISRYSRNDNLDILLGAIHILVRFTTFGTKINLCVICVIGTQNKIQQVTVVLQMFVNNLIVYLAGYNSTFC